MAQLTAAHETSLSAAGLSTAEVAKMKTLSQFNWLNILALLQKDAPIAVLIIKDVLAAFGV